MNLLDSQPKKALTSQLSRLQELGLKQEYFINAVSSGISESFKSTALHPVTDKGIRGWGEIIASLRAELLTRANGWSEKRDHGLELTTNSSLGLSIIVSSGDSETGSHNGNPYTKNSKGYATQKIVEDNSTLFEMNSFSSDSADTMSTWVLLYFFDDAEKEVRFELSLPIGLVGKGRTLRVGSWKERIIFSPISFEENVKIEKDFTDDVNFELNKKQG